VSIFSANVVIRTAPALVLVGLVALVPPVRAGLERVPEGTWAVAQATLNGEYRAESKILNSTWTFRGDELVVQQAGGARLRWALTFDPAAEPPAFRATPPDAPGERPVWMIVSRRNDELRLAFYDGLDQRPEDFGPRRKLVVLTLVPAPPATPAADPCEILRGAGADRLLGRHPHRWRHRGTRRAGWLSFVSLHGRPTAHSCAAGLLRQEPPRASRPGVSCALERDDGSGTVSLTLVAPPAGAAYVDAARRETEAGRRVQVEDEPTLGPGAFSGVRGWTVIAVALKRGTAMLLRFEAPMVARAELRQFSERVRDRL
jgi:uncharacterized protein (TIGR03067 family)